MTVKDFFYYKNILLISYILKCLARKVFMKGSLQEGARKGS